MSKPTASKTRKLSQTTQILENVEMLLALHEDQSAQSIPTADAFDPKSIETIINRRFEKLEKQLLEKPPASSASLSNVEDVAQSIDALVELVSDQLNQQTSLIDKKISELAGAANKGQPSGLKRELDGFETKLDALANEIETIQKSVDNQTQTFEKITRELATSVSALAANSALADKAAASDSVDRSVASTTQNKSNESLDDTSEDPSGHWQAQKEAMLAKYGIDPDYRPVVESKSTQESDAHAILDVEDAAAEKLGELHDTINSISPEDKDAIDKLKKDLNSKLRDAEVELSIQRARLSQEKAELEHKAADLERRAADMEARLKAAKKSQQANGKKSAGDSLMSRFTRHLGK